MRQLIIINRDGVINERIASGVLTPEQFRPLPGSLEAVARLNHAGASVAVIATRPDTPEGLLSIEAINHIHAHLQQLLARRGGHIDAFFIDTEIREPGKQVQAVNGAKAIETICERFSTTPGESVLLINAPHPGEKAIAAGILPILVGNPSPEDLENDTPWYHSNDLMSATDFLLKS